MSMMMMLKRRKGRQQGTSHRAWQTETWKACDKGGQEKQRGAYLWNWAGLDWNRLTSHTGPAGGGHESLRQSWG